MINEFADVDSKISSNRLDIVYESLVIRDEEGNIVGYEDNLINAILDKSIDEMSYYEIEAIALLFVGTDSDYGTEKHIELQNLIINGCLQDVPTKIDQIKYEDPASIFEISYYEKNGKMALIAESLTQMENNFQIQFMSLDTEDERDIVRESNLYSRIGQSKAIFDYLNSKDGTFEMVSHQTTHLKNADKTYFRECPIELKYDIYGYAQIKFQDSCDSMLSIDGFTAADKYYSYTEDNLHQVEISPILIGTTLQTNHGKEDLSVFVRQFAQQNGIITSSEELKTEMARDIGKYAFDKLFGGIDKIKDIDFIHKDEIQLGNEIVDNFNELNTYQESSKTLVKNADYLNHADNYNLGTVRIEEIFQGETSVSYIPKVGIGTHNMGNDHRSPSTYQVVNNINSNLDLCGEERLTVNDVLLYDDKIGRIDIKLKEKMRESGMPEDSQLYYDEMNWRKMYE